MTEKGFDVITAGDIAERTMINRATFYLYINKHISFADAYNAAYILLHQVSEVYSWDTDFDKIENITRLEPEST